MARTPGVKLDGLRPERLDTIEMEFYVDLTPEELKARADELAVLIQEINEDKEAQKEAAKAQKGEIAVKEIRKNKLADTYRQRREPRMMPVDIVNAGNSRVRLIRVDTGETVGERPMTDLEMQRSIPNIAQATSSAPTTSQSSS